MVGTCGEGCSGLMTVEVGKRIEEYADMCILKGGGGVGVEGERERIDWAAQLRDMGMLNLG